MEKKKLDQKNKKGKNNSKKDEEEDGRGVGGVAVGRGGKLFLPV